MLELVGLSFQSLGTAAVTGPNTARPSAVFSTVLPPPPPPEPGIPRSCGLSPPCGSAAPPCGLAAPPCGLAAPPASPCGLAMPPPCGFVIAPASSDEARRGSTLDSGIAGSAAFGSAGSSFFFLLHAAPPASERRSEMERMRPKRTRVWWEAMPDLIDHFAQPLEPNAALVARFRRPPDEQRLALDVLERHRPPGARIAGVLAVVAHHEDVAVGHHVAALRRTR